MATGMCRAACLGVLLLAGFPRAGTAQSLRPGERIRVVRREPPGTTIVGRFLRSSGDSLWLETPGRSEVVVALGPGARLDRSQGTRSRAGLGALIGAGVGAATTVTFLTAFCGGDNRCDGDEQVRAVAIFGLPAVALGAGIGALVRVERWVPVAPWLGKAEARLQLGLRVAW